MSKPRQYLEFYRLDMSSSTKAILIPAASLVTFGSAFVCVAGARISIGFPRDAVGFFGGAVVLVGLVVGFGGMARLLSHDGFVGVTKEGVHVRAPARDEFIPWDDVSKVQGSAPIELVLKDERAVSLPKLSAPAGLDLRERFDALRRKASLDLLGR